LKINEYEIIDGADSACGVQRRHEFCQCGADSGYPGRNILEAPSGLSQTLKTAVEIGGSVIARSHTGVVDLYASAPSVLVAVLIGGIEALGLLADRSSELIQAALRAGADDVFSLPPSSDDALRALLRANAFRLRAGKRNPNELCALVSVSGGLGVSHLTVILGFAVRRLLEKRAALVDLDLQAAPLAVLLDVDPERTIADLADPTSPIDSIRLESVLAKHDSGLSLLAAPKQIEQAELVSAATVEAALKVLHVLFDVVLIDCGSHLNESSVVVFENSDHLLYVLDQSVTSIRAAQRFLNLYGRLGLNARQPHLVVNRYRSNDVIKLEQIETALHLPVFATVPLDNAVFRQMQVPGLDLWNISSGASLRRSFETLTRKLFVAEQSEAATKPSLFSRLFGSFGR